MIKKIFKYIATYLICLGAITTLVALFYVFYPQKTFHLEKKQWRPAAPETQNFDQFRLAKALEYIDTRLPTARSLLILRNGKTVVEKYYWFGGPKKTDYLHSLNLPLLQVLIGVAIDQQLIPGPEQSLSVFFPQYLKQPRFHGMAPLALSHLLRARAPLIWGSGSPDYWNLFYAEDRTEACLRVVFLHQTGIQPAVNFAAAYLLSQVIEQVSGQSVFDFAHRNLFQPLGITTYVTEDEDLPRDTFVGFQLKALDLAKIGYLLARKGAWEGQRIVSRKWIRRMFSKAPQAELTADPLGIRVQATIGGYESLLMRGEGGQYLVLVPAQQVVVVITSISRFALPQNNGHDRLMTLIMDAVLQPSDTEGMVSPSEKKSKPPPGIPIGKLPPNYVFSTPVPRGILDFFDQFAQDIASKDQRRIARNYARAYHLRRNIFGRNIFDSPYPLLLFSSPPPLQYVHFTKIRIEKNRAYLRGTMKFDYRNVNAGLDGRWPLENMIKLKGRWRFLGLPKKTALLDRDDYFEAELSETHQQFVADCSGPLVGKSSVFGNDCFTAAFQLAGGGKELFARRLQPFLKGRSGVKLHVTGMQRTDSGYRVQGYIEGSLLGDIRLPDDLHIVQENGAWKWQGVIDSKQTR
jgi:CubicO group peptidase (beta-lactamase class C family)